MDQAVKEAVAKALLEFASSEKALPLGRTLRGNLSIKWRNHCLDLVKECLLPIGTTLVFERTSIPEDLRHKGSFVFGAGPHLCPAQDLVKTLLEGGLTMLVLSLKQFQE